MEDRREATRARRRVCAASGGRRVSGQRMRLFWAFRALSSDAALRDRLIWELARERVCIFWRYSFADSS